MKQLSSRFPNQCVCVYLVMSTKIIALGLNVFQIIANKNIGMG